VPEYTYGKSTLAYYFPGPYKHLNVEELVNNLNYRNASIVALHANYIKGARICPVYAVTVMSRCLNR
jgi:hypothetical protein